MTEDAGLREDGNIACQSPAIYVSAAPTLQQFVGTPRLDSPESSPHGGDERRHRRRYDGRLGGHDEAAAHKEPECLAHCRRRPRLRLDYEP